MNVLEYGDPKQMWKYTLPCGSCGSILEVFPDDLAIMVHGIDYCAAGWTYYWNYTGELPHPEEHSYKIVCTCEVCRAEIELQKQWVPRHVQRYVAWSKAGVNQKPSITITT